MLADVLDLNPTLLAALVLTGVSVLWGFAFVVYYVKSLKTCSAGRLNLLI